MAFTEEERRRWHEEKRRREQRPVLKLRLQPVAICISCQRPFGINEGVVTDEASICDVCNGE